MPVNLKNYKATKKLHIISLVALTVLAYVAIYTLNYYTPLYADDYSYSFSFSSGEKITSFSQLMDSQIAHYQIMNGRFVVHFLVQLFLLIGQEKFNYINAFAFLALAYLMYFHACGTYKNFSNAKWLTIVALLFLSAPAFGQSFLWITGAANYLYGILIILLFLIPYRVQADRPIELSLLKEIIASLAVFLFGIIAGWTNENTAVAMIVMLIGYLVLYRIRSIKIHVWNIAGVLGGGIGLSFMLFSPGTAHRLEMSDGTGGIIAWVKRAIFYTCDIITYTHLVMLLFAVLAAIYIYIYI